MLSAYIHIPFCLKKCNYCAFVSTVGNTVELQANYTTALLKEIKLAAKHNALSERTVGTAFFGGGTPSALPLKYLEQILETICNNLNVSKLEEISIEVNPATNIDFEALKTMGFNRISIGVQSFNDAELQFLGRLHNAETATQTIKNVQKHFENISIDLIYGIPGQTIESFEQSLDKAINTGLPHVSAYSLIFEPGTNLHQMQLAKQCQPANEALECAMYDMLCCKLQQHGIYQYEVSNFAKAGAECKHNKAYWERSDYIGFGVSAHSLLHNTRFFNTNDTNLYTEQLLKNNTLPRKNKEILTSIQIFEEEIFLGLRSHGIKQTILNPKQFAFMESCVSSNYAIKTNAMFVLTNSGRLLTDSIVLKLL